MQDNFPNFGKDSKYLRAAYSLYRNVSTSNRGFGDTLQMVIPVRLPQPRARIPLKKLRMSCQLFPIPRDIFLIYSIEAGDYSAGHLLRWY